MSFKDYIREFSFDMGDIGELKASSYHDYKGMKLDFDTIADIIANTEDMYPLMGKEGVSLEDLENNTTKFFDFMIRHLEELKKRYNFSAEYEDLRKDYGNKYV